MNLWKDYDLIFQLYCIYYINIWKMLLVELEVNKFLIKWHLLFTHDQNLVVYSF